MIAGGNHTFIPNQPPVSCDYDPALAGGRLPPLPSQIPHLPPSHRTSPVPPGSHPLVGDGALDVPFRMPSMPVHKRRGVLQSAANHKS